MFTGVSRSCDPVDPAYLLVTPALVTNTACGYTMLECMLNLTEVSGDGHRICQSNVGGEVALVSIEKS